MPVTRIELSRPQSSSDKARLAQFVQETLVDVIKIPADDRVIRIVEHEPGNFYTSVNGTGNYALIEITLFPGRTLDAKRELYKRLCEGMAHFGISPSETRVILYEVPKENWGIRGGQAGIDVA